MSDFITNQLTNQQILMFALTFLTLLLCFIYEIKLRKARKVIAEAKLDLWTARTCLNAMYQLNDSLIHRLKQQERNNAPQ